MLTKLTRSLLNSTPNPRYFYGVWKDIPMGPPDPVLGVGEAFKKSTNPKKVNLSIGAYRDSNGKPVVLKSVRKAEEIIFKQNLDNEYLPTEGSASFIKNALILAYGQDVYNRVGSRIAGAQALSGTGALRLACEFLKRYTENAAIYFPDPTWPNHNNIARDSGLKQGSYYWYDAATKSANFQRAYEDIKKLPDKQIILLHACAHNPTGCDLNLTQWKEFAELFQRKGHLAFFDMAYQGFTSGDIHKDAEAVRYFVNQDIPVLLCQSFAKNMGLYGQRIGATSIVLKDQKTAEAAVSQLKIIGRPIWSNPPLHGARIVDTVLGTPDIYNLWLSEVKEMADRIALMRKLLVENLKKQGSKWNWDHIQNQQGMFAFTGLKEHHCEELVNKYHVFLLKSGRISVAGVNNNNVEYLAEAFHTVTKNDGI